MSSEPLIRYSGVREHKLDGYTVEFRKMLGSGKSVGEIATYFDMTENAVYSFIRRRGLAKSMRYEPAKADVVQPFDDGTPGTVTVTIKPNGRATVSEIKQACCQYFRITQRQMEGLSRARRFAWPRQLAMALSRKLTPLSYPAIGQRYGGRDHTTVLYAQSAVAERIRLHADWAEHHGALLAHLTPLPVVVAEAAE